ncbi:MAG: exo-alpha-sialidase [Verrucomicrobia bacterium]|nr:exo-alpha-sialidase [Verrucomicrobiota bacterium]
MILKRKVFSHQPGRAPLCGFIIYIDAIKRVLLRRIGWEVSNDIHDNFSDAVSHDNGKTWGESRSALSSVPAPGGVIVHTENAALYLADRNLLIHWTNDKLESSLEGGYDPDASARIRITTGDPNSVSKGMAPDVFISDFGLKQGIYVSFATPFLDSHGRVLAPVQWQKKAHLVPANLKPTVTPAAAERIGARDYAARKDMPEVFSDVWEVGLLIGEFQKTGNLNWRVGKAVPCKFDKSSRGMCEGTVAELSDGRFCMILRGSNEAWPEKPGYKWLSFSEDGGTTWSEVVPLPCDDGSVIESSATGSALFRSIKNNQLYWIGNLCLEGRRPNGNMPRSPLYIAEMQESPVAIKRKTITVIDRAQPGEHPDTQHSNFKFYQDRETGDVVLYLTRYGERGYPPAAEWIDADLYQYRVSLD